MAVTSTPGQMLENLVRRAGSRTCAAKSAMSRMVAETGKRIRPTVTDAGSKFGIRSCSQDPARGARTRKYPTNTRMKLARTTMTT